MSKIVLKEMTNERKILIVGLVISFFIGMAGIGMYTFTGNIRYLYLLLVYVIYRLYLHFYKGE